MTFRHLINFFPQGGSNPIRKRRILTGRWSEIHVGLKGKLHANESFEKNGIEKKG